MRTATILILFAIAALAAPMAFACDKCGKPPNAQTKKSGKDKDIIAAHDAHRPGKVYEISVPDMGCDNCVKVLREKLKKLEGVIEVEGDLDNKTLRVGVDESKELKEDEARKVIKGAGYTWGGIKELGARKNEKTVDEQEQAPKGEPAQSGGEKAREGAGAPKPDPAAEKTAEKPAK